MRVVRIATSVLTLFILLVSFTQAADAQILKKLGDRAKERLKQKSEEKANEAVDNAVDDAVDDASDAATNAVKKSAEKEATRQVEAATSGMSVGSGAGASSSGNPSDPVDFRELKKLLPTQIGTLERTEATGQKAGAFGIKTSTAVGEYGEGSSNGGITLTIADMGTLSSAGMLGYAWLSAEIDSETETGYERTTKYNGYPAYEKFNKDGDYATSEIQVVVGQRFVVSAESDSDQMDLLKNAINQVDLAQLAALVPNATTGSDQASVSGGVEPVDFNSLKALLPAGLPGLNRSNASGQKSSALGIKVSTAEGEYTSESGEGSATITLTDMGNLASATMMGYVWLNMEVDNETDRGYEKTIKYKDFPAYEKLDREGNQTTSEIQVVVGQRFVVSIHGDNISMDTVKAALDNIDLQALAAMK